MATLKNEQDVTNIEMVDFSKCLEEHLPVSLWPEIKRLLYGSNVEYVLVMPFHIYFVPFLKSEDILLVISLLFYL